MGRRWGRAAAGEAPAFEAKNLVVDDRRGARRVFYVERGQRFDAKLDASSPLPAHRESEAAREFRLQLQARHLLGQGQSKEAVAKALDKALGWVSLCQRLAIEDVVRPRDIPPYVADYNLRMLRLGIEPFRPAVLLRRYAQDTEGLYLECAQQMPWRQAVFRKRNYQTGEVAVTNIASSRQDCSYKGLSTGIPRLDAVLARLRRDFDIKDPHAFLLNNFYPDGNTSIAPHQHDFWSAIISFGASRIFTVDGDPVLLGDGDVIVIGTQRHSVPKMPEVKEGRVSVAIFWYPENSGHAEEACLQRAVDRAEGAEGHDEDIPAAKICTQPMSSPGSPPLPESELDAGPEERCAECGSCQDVQPGPQGAFCSDCWQRWEEDADAAMLEAALQLSLVEQ